MPGSERWISSLALKAIFCHLFNIVNSVIDMRILNAGVGVAQHSVFDINIKIRILNFTDADKQGEKTVF